MNDFGKKIWLLLSKLVPKTRVGDKFIAYANFLRSHRRLPSRRLLNDRLFSLKTSDEILDVLRQYTTDKEFVKAYIKNCVGDMYNVETKAILRNEHEIRNYPFSIGDVAKPTHSSGLVYFVDKLNFDKDVLVSWIHQNYYDKSREANYRYLSPKIIIENPIFGRFDVEDIKFFCVEGIVKVIQWDFDRHEHHTRMLYDRGWNALDASLGYPKAKKCQRKPKKLDEMIGVAEKLAKPFSLVRIDMYYDEETETFLVGEITHCHGSANESFDSAQSEIRVAKVLFD